MDERPVEVLLIEDNPGDARLIREFLRDAAGAFRLRHAATLAHGWDALAAGRVDLVLLDLSLPDSQGIETFERVHLAAPSVPIVVLSGLADEDLAVAAVRAGAQDYLVKGHVDENLLGRAIRYALERQRLEDAQRFLAEASRTLAGSLDEATTLQRVAELAVPVLGDRCAIDLVEPDGTIHQAAVAAREVLQAEALGAFRRSFPIHRDDPRNPIARVIARREAVLYPRLAPSDLEDLTSDAAQRDAAAALGVVAALIVPLVARERVLGALTLLAVESGRAYGPADRDLAVALAQRAALAIDNARLYRQAQEAIRVRDLVLSSVAHDLRAPLTPIKLAGETLRWQIEQGQTDDPAPLLEGLRSIDAGVEKMAAQIDELLDVARLQMGREVALHRRRTDLVGLVRAQVADYQARTRRHQFRLEAESDSFVAWVDARRIERVVGNLLSNALKYSPKGGEVVARLRREEGPGEGWAVVEVQDPGVGIAAADLPRLFTWFFRGERVAADFPGTGIGLAGAARIVELHGGVITVRSVEGEGATFTVRLPFGPPRLDEPPE